jgi:hypothetical protein
MELNGGEQKNENGETGIYTQKKRDDNNDFNKEL